MTLPFLEEAFEGLKRCVDQRMSGGLIAPAGSGKTALIRRLAASLPEARHHVTYVKVTCLSKRDMCKEISRAMGSELAGTYASLVAKLQTRVHEILNTDARRPVLILDEAHDLRPDVLAILRVLTNFEMDSRLVMSILLVGQPSLREMLARDDQEAVTRRLSFIGTLRLLSREETNRYVKHRCTIAGVQATPFDESALETIYELSRGNMRAIDSLALESLVLADQQEDAVVTGQHVVTVRKHLWP
jgi:general secretion pathway protein A